MTTAQEELIERMRSYIRYNATKDPASIRKLLERGHEQLTSLIDGLSSAQVTFKPTANDWSVLEVLRHVVGSQRGIARRCPTLARGEESASFEPEEEAGRFESLAAAREAMDAAHNELLAFVNGLTSSKPNLETRFEHPVFGALNCREWAVFRRVHDGDHSGQIEQIRAAPGFPSV
jgi:uncharacterized damage-inducible protein DinB